MYRNGAVLIDLFFVMSGLLMYELYRHRLGTTAELKEFMFRRFARIYPLHLVSLVAMVLLALILMLAHQIGLARIEPGEILPFHAGAEESIGAIFAHLFLVHSLGVLDHLTFNDPSWSVSVEFYCYLSFAVMMFLCPPRKKSHFALIFVVVVATYAWLATVKDNMNFHTDLGYFRGAAAFLVGILASRSYLWLKPRIGENPSSALIRSCTILEILLTVGIFVFIHFCHGKDQFTFAPISFSLILIFSLGFGRLSKLFSRPVMLYLGRISYSVYMWHMLFAYIFGRVFERVIEPLTFWLSSGEAEPPVWLGDLLFVPYLIVVVIASHYSYRYIEAGARKWLLDWWNQEEVAQKPFAVEAEPVVQSASGTEERIASGSMGD